MGWDPGERPAWVRAVLAGDGGPAYESGRRPFVADELLAEAAFRAGSDDFGSDSHLEPLAVLVESLEHEVPLHLVGRWRAREVVLRYLENRARLVRARTDDPGIAHESITAPLLVTGSPRAGTSIMHQLLAAGPAARAPLAWEYWSPAPAERRAGATDPRIALANADVRLSAALAPIFDGMHEQGALLPREDASAMGVDLRADVLSTHYGVPSFARWLSSADMDSAYQWHRLVLQVLQRHVPTSRWVLKWPGHVNHLPTALATYPDARIVICHRDPVAMLSSVASLTATLRWAHASDVDFEAVSMEMLDTFSAQCERLVAWDRAGLLDPARVCHVRFEEFMADQLSAVARVHDQLGLDFDATHEAAVRAHLADKPAGRLGGHQHQPDALGFRLEALRERFAPYMERFGLGEG